MNRKKLAPEICSSERQQSPVRTNSRYNWQRPFRRFNNYHRQNRNGNRSGNFRANPNFNSHRERGGPVVVKVINTNAERQQQQQPPPPPPPFYPTNNFPLPHPFIPLFQRAHWIARQQLLAQQPPIHQRLQRLEPIREPNRDYRRRFHRPQRDFQRRTVYRRGYGGRPARDDSGRA